jgi:hypothetical protein
MAETERWMDDPIGELLDDPESDEDEDEDD